MTTPHNARTRAYMDGDYAVYLTMKSSNSKVGTIPVATISDETCPDNCGLKYAADGIGKGPCYAASGGPLAILWKALSAHAPGAAWTNGVGGRMQSLTWNDYCAAVATFPIDQAHRYAQAGDLPGRNNTIDRTALDQLVTANAGKRGWTYTHKPMHASRDVPMDVAASNIAAVADANARGFTINLSADNLAQADTLAELDIAPVAVVLPDTVHGNVTLSTPQGRTVVVCPATYRDDVSCGGSKIGGVATKPCMLCQRRDRKCIIGFPAHGASKRKASAVASNAHRVVITRNNQPALVIA